MMTANHWKMAPHYGVISLTSRIVYYTRKFALTSKYSGRANFRVIYNAASAVLPHLSPATPKFSHVNLTNKIVGFTLTAWTGFFWDPSNSPRKITSKNGIEPWRCADGLLLHRIAIGTSEAPPESSIHMFRKGNVFGSADWVSGCRQTSMVQPSDLALRIHFISFQTEPWIVDHSPPLRPPNPHRNAAVPPVSARGSINLTSRLVPCQTNHPIASNQLESPFAWSDVETLPSNAKLFTQPPKAGIVCKLNARATVVAVTNPVGGIYNETLSLEHNSRLGSALLSRFDLIFIMLDQAECQRDMNIAQFLLQ